MSPPDILSDVFQTMRLRTELYFAASLTAPYAIEIPHENRVVRFHLVRHGRCWLGDRGAGPGVSLAEGDLVILPNGRSHILADRQDTEVVTLAEILRSGALEAAGLLRYGGDGERLDLLCGFCSFDEGIRHPLIANLPDRIVLKDAELDTHPGIRLAISLLDSEANRGGQGMNAIVCRLLEIVFVQAVRRTDAANDATQIRFLPALADKNLSRALRAIHRHPESPWTSTALAREAGMSRTQFAAKFSQLVGDTPMKYVANWRLSRARTLLSDTNLPIDEIALRCGYRSLPSFTRRFKAEFGQGPGAFRRGPK
ncbi:MAG: AraC family transcriptional regulator [Alphaproteobacteria bacterium]|nr:AraC family transcriptional regulator [Alphaproteobacteria bacterium]